MASIRTAYTQWDAEDEVVSRCNFEFLTERTENETVIKTVCILLRWIDQKLEWNLSNCASISKKKL